MEAYNKYEELLHGKIKKEKLEAPSETEDEGKPEEGDLQSIQDKSEKGTPEKKKVVKNKRKPPQ
eukprot:6879133-Lingulodinium_polyedra.AAC.1